MIANGPHTLSADATNSIATSARSAFVPFSYVIPPPSIVVTSPAAGAIVAGEFSVGASVIDQRAGTRVEFFLNGSSIGIDEAAPFALNVAIASLSEGVKTVRALLRNSGPTTAEATSSCTVWFAAGSSCQCWQSWRAVPAGIATATWSR